MPIHNVGYRGWDGKRTSPFSRWWIITETGVQLIFKSAWVKRILFLAWIPVIYWGTGFFFAENGIKAFHNEGVLTPENIAGELLEAEDLKSGMQQLDNKIAKGLTSKAMSKEMRRSLFFLPKIQELADAIESGQPTETRGIFYRWGMMTFFRYPQGTLILFLLGFIAPGLIARDVRSRAFLLYFSRPIGRIEYLVGKIGILAMYIAAVTTLPALLLYLFAVMMAPDLSVALETWDIPLRIILASLLLIIPTASLALMLSSLTHETRFASFAWFAVWALGHGAWLAIFVSQSIQTRNYEATMSSSLVQNWSVLSLYNNLGEVQSWAFGFNSLIDIWPAAATLLGISLFSLFILYRRISAPINV